MTDIADLRITTDTKPLENLILKLKELAAQGKVTQQVLASIKVPNIPRGGGVYINTPRGGSGGPNVGPIPIPGMAPRSSGTSPAGRRAGITGGGFGQAFTTGNNSFADRMREAAKAAQLLQGPLGGVAARLITLANVVENFNAASAVMSISILAVAAAMLVFAGNAVMMGDRMVMLHARVRTIVGDNGSVEGSFKSVAEIAKTTGNAMETVVDVYNRVSLGAKNLGKSNAEILNVVDLATKTGILSGTPAGAQQNALLQFGQAIGAGTVHAEEFNSLLENMPKLADEIAKGMGTTASHLRQMVITGKVLSKDIFEALQKRTLEINAEFRKLPVTISRSMGAFGTELGLVVDGFNQNLQASQAVASVLQTITALLRGVGTNIDHILSVAKGFLVVFGTAGFLLLLHKAVVAIASIGTTMQTSIVANLALTRASLAMIASGDIVAIRLGMQGLAVATQQTSAAAASLAAIVKGIGIAALLLTLTALSTAFFDIQARMERAAKTTDELVSRSRELIRTKVTENGTIMQLAKAYDERVKSGKRDKETQDLLRAAQETVADKLGITTDRVKELAKQYGSLAEAIRDVTAEQAYQAEKQEVADLVHNKYWESVQARLKTFGAKALAVNSYGMEGYASKENDARVAAALENKINHDYEEAVKRQKNMPSLAEFKKQAMERYKLQEKLDQNPAVTTPDTGKETKSAMAKYIEDLKAEKTYTLAAIEARRKGERAFLGQMNALKALEEVESKNFKKKDLAEAKVLLGMPKATDDQIKQKLVAMAAENKRLAQREEYLVQAQEAARKEKQQNKERSALEKGGLAGYYLQQDQTELENRLKPYQDKLASKAIDQKEYDQRAASVTQSFNQEKSTEVLKNLKQYKASELAVQSDLRAAYQSGNLEKIRQAKIEERVIQLKNQLLPLLKDETNARNEATRRVNNEDATALDKEIQDQKRKSELVQEQIELSKQGYEWDQKRQEFVIPALEAWTTKQQALNEMISAGVVNLEDPAILDSYMKRIQAEQDLGDLQQQNMRVAQFQQQALAQLGDNMANTLVDALNGGKSSFHDFAMSVLKDLELMIFKAFIFNKLFGGQNPFTGQQQQGWIGTALKLASVAASAANPAAAAGTAAGKIAGSLISAGAGYAKGDAFANGATLGVFGEAGPEAILPLRRGSDGKLGVIAGGHSGGGGVAITNNISVNANGGTKEQNADLAQKIGKEIDGRMKEMVTQQIAEQMRSGNMLNRKRTI